MYLEKLKPFTYNIKFIGFCCHKKGASDGATIGIFELVFSSLVRQKQFGVKTIIKLFGHGIIESQIYNLRSILKKEKKIKN